MKNLVLLSLIILLLTGCNLLPQVEKEENVTIEAVCINGTITPTKVLISKGDSVIFTVTPDDGYFVEKILVDQKSIEIPSDNTFSVSDISSDLLVKVNCKKRELKNFTISANVIGMGGTVSPSGNVTVKESSNQTFTFVPNLGAELKEIKINGTIVSWALSHTFYNVSSDQKLEVSFSRKDSILWYLGNIVWRLDSTYFYTEEDGMARFYDFDRNLTWEFLPNGTCAETVDGNTIYPTWSVNKNVSPAILAFDENTVSPFHFKIERLDKEKLIYSWVVSEKEKRWGVYVRERYK